MKKTSKTVKNRHISIKIPADLYDAAKKSAVIHDRSLAQMIRIFIKDGVAA